MASYVIDLSGKNATKLRESFAEYVAVAREERTAGSASRVNAPRSILLLDEETTRLHIVILSKLAIRAY